MRKLHLSAIVTHTQIIFVVRQAELEVLAKVAQRAERWKRMWLRAKLENLLSAS